MKMKREFCFHFASRLRSSFSRPCAAMILTCSARLGVLVLLLIASCFRSQFALGTEPDCVKQGKAPPNRKELIMANPAGRTAKAPPNGKELIEALVSRNLAPSILENAQPGQIPLFAKDYNWADQDRVRGAIQHLVDHAERVWPDIVAHLDDNRYSITYELFDAPKNLSVADVCKWIISDYLSQAYIWHIPEIGERQFWAFYIPDVARHGNAALKVWCEVRSKKKLYELQIEICDWAIPKATASDGPLSEFSEERRRAVVAGIKGEIAELRESKRAVKVEHFGVRGADAWGLYTRERIENKKKAAAKGEGMF